MGLVEGILCSGNLIIIHEIPYDKKNAPEGAFYIKNLSVIKTSLLLSLSSHRPASLQSYMNLISILRLIGYADKA